MSRYIVNNSDGTPQGMARRRDGVPWGVTAREAYDRCAYIAEQCGYIVGWRYGRSAGSAYAAATSTGTSCSIGSTAQHRPREDRTLDLARRVHRSPVHSTFRCHIAVFFAEISAFDSLFRFAEKTP